MSASPPNVLPDGPRDLPRRLGFWPAVGVMVGVIIGSGIFATPVTIAKHLDSEPLILGLWILAGVLCVFGAMAFAELASLFPQSGGVYVFLREAYGPGVAFVFGWTYFLITKPFAAAGLAIFLAQSGASLVPYLPFDVPWTLGPWGLKLATVAILIALTIVNVWGVTLGARVALVLTIAKYAALVAITAIGLLAIAGLWPGADLPPRAPLNAPVTNSASTPGFEPGPLWSALLPVMFAIMWTYDGWADVGAIAGEIKRPQVTLPRVYGLGLLAVILVYVLINVVYLRIVPLDEMRTLTNDAGVAPLVMERLVGPESAALVALLIFISTLGSTHASVLTGARVTFAQARDRLLFSQLARIHPTRQTPHVALWVQCLMSCVVTLVLGGFQALASSFVFTMWIFYGVAALAVFVLRVRRPDLHRTFRAWGYPVAPALFILAAVMMTSLSVAAAPSDTLPWIGVLVLGWPVYALWRTRVIASEGR
ncbi:MAG: amino acid permease [Planctomycetota bacterium]|nr:amino acid permease [Planctomycetota bacterium]